MATNTKDERLDLRLPAKLKRTIERAAALSGQTVSTFILGTTVRRARQVIREGTERFKTGRQVVIFPEGTRKAPGDPPDYKPGIAALYRELNVPVYPVATNAGVHWPAHGFLRKPGTIVFEYLEPIPPGLKRAEFMRILEQRIETKSRELMAL